MSDYPSKPQHPFTLATRGQTQAQSPQSNDQSKNQAALRDKAMGNQA